MMENNSDSRQAYNERMMAQQTQALESLHKTLSPEHTMEPNRPNGTLDGEVSELVVGPGEVCKNGTST